MDYSQVKNPLREVSVIEEMDYAKELGHPLKDYYDINGIKLTKYAAFIIDEHGGFPEKYASRITILKASTGAEEFSNPVIVLALDGKEIGCLMALFNRPISYNGKEGMIILNIDPDNKHIKKSLGKGIRAQYKETFFGKEIIMYSDSIQMDTLVEMFDFYEKYKVELSELSE